MTVHRYDQLHDVAAPADPTRDSSLPPAPMTTGTAIAPARETASTAMAALAKAETEAKFVMAMHRPRHPAQVRTAILAECKRPGFADAALYRRPMGGKCKKCDGVGCPACFYEGKNTVNGLSIRFVEEALQMMGNISTDTQTLLDDDDKQIIRVRVTDLERNSSFQQDVTIRKSVERKAYKGKPPRGREEEVLGRRFNSYGDLLFILRATEDEMLMKTNAAVSKAIRTQGLRVLPGEIKSRAIEICEDIIRTRDAQDPKAALNRMVEAYADIGIDAPDLERYLGRPLTQIGDSGLRTLRYLFGALRDETADWSDIMDRIESAESADDAEDERAKILEENKAAKRARDARRASAKTPVPQEPKPDAEPEPAAPTEAQQAAETPEEETLTPEQEAEMEAAFELAEAKRAEELAELNDAEAQRAALEAELDLG